MTQVFDVERVLAQLTLEEKASLTSGSDFWHTQGVERAGVPAVMVTDGPHGLRKQAEDADHLGLGNSVPATCFPTAAALGSSWDVDLLTRVGEALGRETRANDVAVLLGPGVNIKRTPLCGRNFEYVSEDPVVAGELGTAIVRGIQSQGVGTSLKHFAANNQESDRMRVSAEVDERTLREIYLPAFERVVTKAQPWTVMCAYNKVNGTYASENHWLLTEILRDEWAFEGLVVSDWGAVHDRVPALAAGLDLQMPAAGPRPDEEVVAAVRDGSLDEAVLDVAARRVLHLVARSPAGHRGGRHVRRRRPPRARPRGRRRRVRAAEERRRAAARSPPPRASPSSASSPAPRATRAPARRRSTRRGSTRPLDALRAAGGDVRRSRRASPSRAGRPATTRRCSPRPWRSHATPRPSSCSSACPVPTSPRATTARASGCPTTRSPLLRAVAEVNPRVVVVLANGSAVSVTDWRDLAPAILETWLGGQAGGSAVADLLLGVRTPSGRLTETIPHRIEDTPAFGNFPGEAGVVRYGEGVLVGYRWYDTRAMDVAYPFGHGLSYTTFAYDGITASLDGTDVSVQVTVTNTGSVAGAEVVQVYVRDPEASVLRPTRELKAFAKVTLEPGESREVSFDLAARDLSYWHPGLHRWVVEGGEFVIEVGASSRDLRGSVSLDVEGEPLWGELTVMSTIEEWFAHPVGGPLLQAALVPPADMASARRDHAGDDHADARQGDRRLRPGRLRPRGLDTLVAKAAAG